MAEIQEQIASHTMVGLDTSIFIYHFEDHPTYKPLTKIILQGIQAGEREAVLSTVALMELTVHPWRRNRPDIARHYEALLIHFPHLQLADVTRDTARQAAQLRAKFNIHPADALNVAAALVNGATAYITNDKGLNGLAPVLDIFVLDSYVDI
jgi:predicted nucleic acid-binding protein